MWILINKSVRSQPVLFVFFLSILFISALTVFGVLVLDMMPPIRLTIFTVGQLMLSGTAIWLMWKLEVFDIDDFKFKGMRKGLYIAWFGFLYIAISFFISFMSIPENSFVTPNIFYLLIVILHPFIGTGLFEEVFYRGLVLKILLKKNGDSKRGIIFACVVSSAIFGLLHITNVFAGAPILPTISQVIHATAVGLFFAVIFLRTRKLWIPILLHGLLNVSSQIFNAIISPDAIMQNTPYESAGTDNVGLIIYTLFVSLPLLIAALILFGKVKPDGIYDKKTDVPNFSRK